MHPLFFVFSGYAVAAIAGLIVGILVSAIAGLLVAWIGGSVLALALAVLSYLWSTRIPSPRTELRRTSDRTVRFVAPTRARI